MEFYSKVLGRIDHRLSAIGLPSYLRVPFRDLINKWVTCSGEEWTIKRCKSLKVDFFRYLNGDPCLTPWLAIKRGTPKGVLGSMFRYANTNKKKNQIINSLMVYSLFESTKVTETQSKKFLEGLSAPNLISDKEELSSFSRVVSRYFGDPRKIMRGGNHLLTFRGSESKKSPLIHRDKTVQQSEEYEQELVLFNTDSGKYLYSKYPSLFDPVIDGFGHQKWLRMFDFSNNPVPLYGGNVSFIQEPGYKLRSVANPLRIYQLALNPLGKTLYRLIKDLPWDCTHDQQLAHPFIQHHLSKGETVHSVDLSSATDFFPMDFQITALRAIFGNVPDIDLFLEISRSRWKSPLGEVSWQQGQPLGLYPSFGSFTLTHGLLLYWLAGSSYHHQFFVVGDDVVILDEDLFVRYKSWLQKHGCPYSKEKSISSTKLSEFAGKIITSDSVFSQYKWRRMSDDNFLDICKNIGSKSRSLLSKRQKAIFDSVKNVLPPVGLGFSNPGDNYVTMLERTMPFLDIEKAARRSLMGLSSVITKRLYSDFSTINTDNFSGLNHEIIKSMIVTFDEKVRHIIEKTVFSNYQNILSMIDGFECLPDQVGLDLPLKGVQPSRLTTLQKYERMLSDSSIDD